MAENPLLQNTPNRTPGSTPFQGQIQTAGIHSYFKVAM